MEQRMRKAIEEGLSKKTHDKATVKCFPTYVQELPSGHECGKFLALDLGGTNFRVVVIDIGKDKLVSFNNYSKSNFTQESLIIKSMLLSQFWFLQI